MSLEPLHTISPATNAIVVTRPASSPDEIALLPERGQDAFRKYRASHPTLASRQEIIAQALTRLAERKDVLSRELTEQMGRPIAYTGVEIDTAVKRGHYLNRIASEVLGEDVAGDPEKGFSRYIRREPVGVVLIIFAWNYPYLILVNSLLPALLAGNAVILKPSPQTPTIVEHMAEIFTQAGLPPDVLQSFHSGTPSHVEAIVRAPAINHICFTGSVAGGLAVQRAAADRVVSIGLELGGKDPAYVRADVDPAWAAAEIVDGAIFNAGQSCCAIERVYVHDAVYPAFIAACKTVLARYRLGDPTDPTTQIGPVVSARARDTIRAHIAAALAAGATDETPENPTFSSPLPLPLPPGQSPGNYVPPTLLTNVTPTMAVMRDETFGPVIPVMRVPSDDAAVALMNDSVFGLTASIWTRDVARGEALAHRVDAGTVFVNRADFPSPDLAWTGWKESGRGVTLSRFGFDQFVKLKSLHLKDYPGG